LPSVSKLANFAPPAPSPAAVPTTTRDPAITKQRWSFAVDTEIVALSDRPDLAPAVAGWLLDEFRHSGSSTHEVLTANLLAQSADGEETFILFADGVPVGTASLVKSDLPSRRDLTPWLASVVVMPPFRGRGHSTTLVQHVETVAAAASVRTLWLYTWSAEPVYQRLGWQRVGIERDTDRNIDVVLMRHDL
jgi:N-acetylglutamate synthase-like GNAT family acetyltransferase